MIYITKAQSEKKEFRGGEKAADVLGKFGPMS